MSKLRIFLISTVIFILGTAIGGYAVSWALSEFIMQPMAVSSLRSEAVIDLLLLKALHRGQTDEAIALLENNLDSTLIGLDTLSEQNFDENIAATLERISEYRENHPFTSPTPMIATHVSEILAKHKKAGGQPK